MKNVTSNQSLKSMNVDNMKSCKDILDDNKHNVDLIQDHKSTIKEIMKIDQDIEQKYNQFIFRWYKTMCNREASMPKIVSEYQQKETLLLKKTIDGVARNYAKKKFHGKTLSSNNLNMKDFDGKKIEQRKIDPELLNVVFLDTMKDSQKSLGDPDKEVYEDIKNTRKKASNNKNLITQRRFSKRIIMLNRKSPIRTKSKFANSKVKSPSVFADYSSCRNIPNTTKPLFNIETEQSDTFITLFPPKIYRLSRNIEHNQDEFYLKN